MYRPQDKYNLEEEIADYISFGYPPLDTILCEASRYPDTELPDIVVNAIGNASIKDDSRIAAIDEAFSTNFPSYGYEMVGGQITAHGNTDGQLALAAARIAQERKVQKSAEESHAKKIENYISFGYPTLDMVLGDTETCSLAELSDLVLDAVAKAANKDPERINALNKAFSSKYGSVYDSFLRGSRYTHGIGDMYLSMAEKELVKEEQATGKTPMPGKRKTRKVTNVLDTNDAFSRSIIEVK